MKPTPPPQTQPSWADVLAVFDEVADADVAERPALLDKLCADDEALRGQVQLLLTADESSPDLFMEDADLREFFTPSRPREEVGLRPGGRFAGYEIVELIAEGGMGAVYRARQERPEREVALKVLRAGLTSEDLVRRFEREVAVLGKLQHKGIAAIHAAGVHAGVPYFAMEYVRGAPITEFAAGLEHDRCVALAQAICAAVAHAHEQGVVHRDLKPANILVDGFGEPRVLDFGIARLSDTDGPPLTLATRTGQILGTLAYMSPEQASGDAAAVDGRTDVYSLGVILYELLVGRRPLEVERRPIPEALRIITDVDPVLLGELDPGLRGDLEVIVGKALEKDPARRYASVTELAEDLARTRDDRPIAARPPSTLYQMSKFARRHRALVGGVGATIAALAVGIAFSVNYAIDASEQRDIARTQGHIATEQLDIANDQRDVAEHATAAARLGLYRTSLLAAMVAVESGDASAARTLLAATPEERRGFEYRHFAAQVDQSVVALAGDWTPVAWFPDGERLLLSGGAGLAIWRPDGRGAELETTWRLPARASNVVLSDDGSLVAATIGVTLMTWDVATGASLAEVELAVEPLSVAVRPGSFELALAQSESVLMIDGTSGRTIATWAGLPGEVMDLECTAEGGWLVAATGWDVLCWDLAIQRPGLSWTLGDHNRASRGSSKIVADPTGSRVTARMGKYGQLTSLDVLTGKRVDFVQLSVESPKYWAIDAVRGQHLVTGNVNGSVQLFDSESGELAGKLLTGAHAPRSFAFHHGTGHVAYGTRAGLRVHAGESGREWALTGHQDDVTSLSFSPDGSRLVSSSLREGSVRVWNIEGDDQPGGRVLRGHTNWLLGASFSPDGAWLVTTGWDQTVRLWEVATGDCFATLQSPASKVYGAIFSADSERLTVNPSGSEDYQHDLATGNMTRMAEEALPHLQQNEAGRYSPDAFFAAVGRDETVRLGATRAMSLDAFVRVGGNSIWHSVGTRGSEPIRVEGVVDEHGNAPAKLMAVALSQDSAVYATASRDTNVRLYQTVTQRLIAVLSGHTDWVYGMTFSPDGTRLAAGGRDGTIRLWDLADNESVAMLRGHDSYVHQVAFSPDGETLASVSGDFTARLWDTHTATERAALAAAAWVRRDAIRPRVLALFDELGDGGAVRRVLDDDASVSPEQRSSARIEVLVEALRRQ
jgi:WD40 repeat protein/predicted Ser/Thr protein kinase